MPRVADYSIVTDEWWVPPLGPDPLEFEVPDNIDPKSRSILSFLIYTDAIEDLFVRLRLNATVVWEWRFSEAKQFHFFQEVIAKGLVKPGKNRLTIEMSGDDAKFLKLSDVVLWWQANI
jgi:hypothetical protein